MFELVVLHLVLQYWVTYLKFWAFLLMTDISTSRVPVIKSWLGIKIVHANIEFVMVIPRSSADDMKTNWLTLAVRSR